MKNNTLTSDDLKLDKIPLSEHPRPQFKRDSYICLNGAWDIEFSFDNEIPTSFSKKVVVPFPIESQLSSLNYELKKNEIMYYRKKFKLPKDFINDLIFLHFDGVDQICEVYLNNKLIVKNEGGYIPFNIEISKYIKESNELIVKVIDNLDKSYCYGKQTEISDGMWYTKTSGIWKTVWLESVSNQYFKNIKIDVDLTKVKFNIDTSIKRKTLIIQTPEGEIKKSFSKNEIEIEIPSPRLWSPEDPFLYYFELISETDIIHSYFALRKVEIKEYNSHKYIFLNNNPYFFHGLLDQGYFCDGLLTPKSYKKFEEEIITLKELGFNTLRKHIKIEPHYFYYLCDKLGMVVFQDMVNNGSYKFFRDTALPTVGFRKKKHCGKNVPQDTKDKFIKQMKKTFDLLYNSPSVLYYTIFNEGWGQFDADEVYKLAKEIEPNRIIDATSGWFIEKLSDVDSKHIYFKKIKPKTSLRPIVISEFGGYVYKDNEHSCNLEKTYGYKKYNNIEDFQKGFIELYERDIIPYLPYGLSGAIYTQVSDVEDETNGLYTYDRKVLKVKKEDLQNLKKKLHY